MQIKQSAVGSGYGGRGWGCAKASSEKHENAMLQTQHTEGFAEGVDQDDKRKCDLSPQTTGWVVYLKARKCDASNTTHGRVGGCGLREGKAKAVSLAVYG
ncbi:hypothetical protein FQR65_LT17793 [Abscondita terminalis]|nr:hypothetical protein FQR65_LT17793 [Abscondita terminalis]